MALNFLKLFQPKDKVFYGLFEQVSKNNTLLGKKLKELVFNSDYSERQNLVVQIEGLEHENDEITHTIFTELGKNFITPFDREDIHYLASALDDIADYIQAAAKKFNFYKVDPSDQGYQKFAEIIEIGTETLQGAVMELRSLKNIGSITNAIVKINSIENQGDDIYDMSIERLFATEPDAKEVIKKREIYQVLELVTDKMEDAANVIESILVKYA